MLDPDFSFSIANGAALPGWLALAASPPRTRSAGTVRRITGCWLPLALLYVALLVAHAGGPGGFGSLQQVQLLFQKPGVLAAGWVHYLAFDLFVGSWIAERAAALRWPHVLTVPVLLLTFIFGPTGLLAYALLMGARRLRARSAA